MNLLTIFGFINLYNTIYKYKKKYKSSPMEDIGTQLQNNI